MKILFLADRPPITPIRNILKSDPDIELIVTLGDFDYADIRELADIHDIPKIGVYGNHCSGNYFDDLGIINMHLSTFIYKGIIFGGFQGCVRYKPDPNAIMFTQEEASMLLSSFPKVDIFLSHCPPRGIHDEEEISHQGFDVLRKYCEAHSPKYLFHGHTHPTTGELISTRYIDTDIVFVYEDKVVEILM